MGNRSSHYQRCPMTEVDEKQESSRANEKRGVTLFQVSNSTLETMIRSSLISPICFSFSNEGGVYMVIDAQPFKISDDGSGHQWGNYHSQTGYSFFSRAAYWPKGVCVFAQDGKLEIKSDIPVKIQHTMAVCGCCHGGNDLSQRPRDFSPDLVNERRAADGIGRDQQTAR
jgi:cytochrome c553